MAKGVSQRKTVKFLLNETTVVIPRGCWRGISPSMMDPPPVAAEDDDVSDRGDDVKGGLRIGLFR